MKRYRLYIDESGDHTYYADDTAQRRFLCLTGVVINSEYYRTDFQPSFEALKQEFFPHSPDDPVIFHRKDILNRKSSFGRLCDASVAQAFDTKLLKFFEEQRYRIISVLIDKKTHEQRYGRSALHPYHYCLVAMLERYCGLLSFYNITGDVMVEGRAGREDMLLKTAYQSVFEGGTRFKDAHFFQRTLTSKELKIKPKSSNIAGLQIADLLAHPSKNKILQENELSSANDVFGSRVNAVIEQKYNRNDLTGRIKGYGRVFLG